MGEIGLNDTIEHTELHSAALFLSAVCGADQVSYLVTDSELQQRAVDHQVFDERYPFFDRPLGYLAEIMAHNELLYEDFSEVHVAIHGVPFVITEEDQLNYHTPAEILEGHTRIAFGDIVYSDVIPSSRRSVVYACPEIFEREIHLYFQNARLCHSMLPQIDTALRSTGKNLLVQLSVSSGWLEMVVVDNGKLLFANHYRWSETSDILYFTTAVIRELNIDEQSLYWKFTGPAMTDKLGSDLTAGLGIARRAMDRVEQTNGPVVTLLSLAQCAL